MSRHSKLISYGIVVVTLLILMVVALYFLEAEFFAPQPGVEAVTGQELREYEGVRLSSVADFRENSIKGPQHIDIDSYRLSIDGMAGPGRAYTYADVVDNHTHYRKVATLNCVEGWSVTILWDGIKVRDLLAEAGYNLPAKTITFYCYDGYSTAFPLSYILDNDIMIAYAMNNVTIPPERGYPFQLVAEGKWGYKWAKWITRIELSDSLPTGYWESRGYSRDGDLNRSFLS
jgi:DMSO/TMAO reductase YedYZ molybdopterin-dependent catalytic subunit